MTRGVLDQIPRSSLALLLMSQALVILPHLPRLALWTLAFWGACVVWRTLIYRGRWGYPGRLTKAAFVVLAMVAVGLGHGIRFSLEPAVALLILAFALKLLEMRGRRDALVVIFLGYFVIATQFLFDQGMAMTAYQLGAVIVVTAALVALHQSWNRPRSLASLRIAAIILLQAVPLTLVLFVFFPRVAPLWSVPLPDAGARMGLAETMTPGAITRLGRSSELAFRVEFEDRPPPAPALYWRVMTYSEYDAGTWAPGNQLDFLDVPVHWVGAGNEPSWLRAMGDDEAGMRYSVLAEPTYQPWLFALDVARPLTRGTGLGRDFRVLHRGPLTQRFRYEVESRRAALDARLPEWYQARETRLPAAANPRTRRFVDAVRAEADSPRALAERIMRHFADESFHYTLDPPALGDDDLDEFLFETRRGFCGHYASAFVFMMRHAGYPARVVAGYQGGEFNPVGNYLVVRQYDAHAWAEVWIEDEGWVRFDPTMAVAPDRIERGAEAVFAGNAQEAARGAFAGDSMWRRFDWLAEIHYFLDSLEHRWHVLVVGYDAAFQSRLLRDLLGQITPLRVAVAAGGAAGIAVLIALLGVVPGLLRQRPPPLLRFHDAWSMAFARAGVRRRPAESPRRYAARLTKEFPDMAADVGMLGEWLDDALFGPNASAADDVPVPLACHRCLWRLRWQLLLRRLTGTFASGTRRRGKR